MTDKDSHDNWLKGKAILKAIEELKKMKRDFAKRVRAGGNNVPAELGAALDEVIAILSNPS